MIDARLLFCNGTRSNVRPVARSFVRLRQWKVDIGVPVWNPEMLDPTLFTSADSPVRKKKENGLEGIVYGIDNGQLTTELTIAFLSWPVSFDDVSTENLPEPIVNCPLSIVHCQLKNCQL